MSGELQRILSAIVNPAAVNECDGGLEHRAAPMQPTSGSFGGIPPHLLALSQTLDVFPKVAALSRLAGRRLGAQLAAARISIEGRPSHTERARRLLRGQILAFDSCH